MQKSSKRDGFVEFDLDGESKWVDVHMAQEVLIDHRRRLPDEPTGVQFGTVLIEAAAEAVGQPVSEWSLGRAKLFWDAVRGEVDAEKKAAAESAPPG